MTINAAIDGTANPLGRAIFLNSDISEGSCYEAAQAMVDMDADDSETPIVIFIDSRGGSVLAMLYLYDIRQTIKAPVVTIIAGMAASAGLFLAMTLATPGNRLAYPNAAIMAHSVSGFAKVSTSDVEFTSELNDTAFELMAKACDLSVEEFQSGIDRDTWKYPEDALKSKWIDKIITPVTPVNITLSERAAEAISSFTDDDD